MQSLRGDAADRLMIAANWTAWVSSQEWCAGGVDLIPAAPRALSDVFSLADEQDVDVRRLIAIVSGDPMFTVRVLRLANVAAFAAAGEVTSVQVAVVRLGVRTVRQAVLAACFSALAHSINTYGSRCADELQHAVGTACLARRLAQQLRLPGDDAFVQALLHDVGKLVLLKLRFEFRRLGGPAPSSEEFEEVLTAHHPRTSGERVSSISSVITSRAAFHSPLRSRTRLKPEIVGTWLLFKARAFK
jgi:HD-like signal output (HDOD) protein